MNLYKWLSCRVYKCFWSFYFFYMFPFTILQNLLNTCKPLILSHLLVLSTIKKLNGNMNKRDNHAYFKLFVNQKFFMCYLSHYKKILHNLAKRWYDYTFLLFKKWLISIFALPKVGNGATP